MPCPYLLLGVFEASLEFLFGVYADLHPLKYLHILIR